MEQQTGAHTAEVQRKHPFCCAGSSKDKRDFKCFKKHFVFLPFSRFASLYALEVSSCSVAWFLALVSTRSKNRKNNVYGKGLIRALPGLPC